MGQLRLNLLVIVLVGLSPVLSFGVAEVRAIDKTALGVRNKFNVSPSRAFVIGRLDQPKSIKRRHQSVTQAPVESPVPKLESIAEEMDTRTAQQTTFFM